MLERIWVDTEVNGASTLIINTTIVNKTFSTHVQHTAYRCELKFNSEYKSDNLTSVQVNLVSLQPSPIFLITVSRGLTDGPAFQGFHLREVS